MSKKRKPIDLTALSSVALPQQDPVAAVVSSAKTTKSPKKKVTKKALSKAPAKVARTKTTTTSGKALSETSSSQQASRLGKVGIQFWTTPEVRKALRHHATEVECTMDMLLNEAIQDLMRKHKIA